MLEQIFTNEMTYWLLATALVFTYVGQWMAYKDHLMDIVESTIDRLVEDGYIKTKGEGEKLELLKHWEK